MSRNPASRKILVVTGLAAEARILAGPDAVCVTAPPSALREMLAAASAPEEFSALVSFGLAGGLAPGLEVATLVVADAVTAAGKAWRSDSTIAGGMRRRLEDSGFRAIGGAMFCVDAPVMRAAEKQALHRRTQAVAVDTESHVAADFAQRHGLPLVVLRAVCDTAGRDLPPLATRAIGPDGRLDMIAIGRELAGRPGQLLALPGTALATAKAMAALRRVRRVLGPGLGLGL